MGVTLLLLALLAQPPADSAPRTITSVEVRLPVGADPRLLEQVPKLVAVRKGQALSVKAVRRSLENLFATGRFADVEVLERDEAGGAGVVFLLTPRQNVGAVYVEGASQLTRAEVLAAANLPLGTEYWPERVARAAESVATAYRRRGFLDVTVETQVTLVDEAMSVAFVVVEGAPRRVAAIALAGEPGLPLQRLLAALGVAPGDVLDLERVDAGLEALRALLRRERFFRARVAPAVIDGAGRVVVPIAAGPSYQLIFTGNRAFSDAALTAVLAYDGEEALDELLTQRLRQRLERFYRYRGYRDVRVQPSEVLRPGTRAAALGFAIEEGEPVRVVDLAFEGARAVTAAELREVLRRVMEASAPAAGFEVHPTGDPTGVDGRVARPFAAAMPAPPLDTVLEEAAWQDAARAMTALYRDRGYLKARVALASVEVRGRQARARFAVEEGPRAQLRTLAAAGLPDGFRSDVLAGVRLGAPFSPGELERARQGLTRELGRQGYLFADVQASSLVDEAGLQVDGRLAVTPGPQVKVRAVLPVGQQRTDEAVIAAQATMREGAPLDAEALFSTQTNLLALGVFRSVQVEMLSPERPEPLKTVLLRVRERPRIAGEVGVGYFYAEGPRVVLDGTISNLGGRAVNLTGRGQLNYFGLSVPAASRQVDLSGVDWYRQFGGRLNLSAGSRSVIPGGVGLRFDVVWERVFRPQFRFSRVAGVPTLDWSTGFELPGVEWLRPKLTLALQYEVEWSFVERVGSALTVVPPTNLVDQERLRFLFGEFSLHGGRFSPTLDLRDDALNPTRGLLLQGSAEVTGALSAVDEAQRPVVVNFLKASGLATGYVPLWDRLVLALSARGGRVWPLSQGSTTPPVRRFFLGGATSMRGFNEDQLVAEDVRALYRGEVRDCQVLAAKDGCSSAAQTIAAERQVPSQGGELFAVFKGELRVPVTSAFDLGLFFELGNLWLAVPTSLGPFRPVTGAGLRYGTPIGPLALDVGVNLDPDLVINEPRVVVHFNIGVF